MNPKISVIMSVHNGMPYLKTSVESIVKQSYKNFEFIIVNDASTDGSWQYLKSIKDKRITLLKNTKNLGLATSLNKALKHTQGNFIARMDADDICLPKRFETQLKFMEDNPDIDLCGSWVKLIDKKGKIVGDKTYPTSSAMINKVLPLYNPIIHPTFFAKRSFFIKNHGYDEKYDYSEDYELLMRTKKNYKFANINRYLLKFRIGQTHRSSESIRSMDVVEIKVKLNNLKKEFYNPIVIVGLIKKLITTLLIPSSVKKYLARILKLS